METSKINILQQPTSKAWVEQAIANLDTILLDHSHGERKAAGVAVNLMFRYPSYNQLVLDILSSYQGVEIPLHAW